MALMTIGRIGVLAVAVGVVVMVGSGGDRQNSLAADECEVVASTPIGAEGGELLAPSDDSPIADARVVFPPGALSTPAVASLGYCNRTAQLHAGAGSGVFLVLAVAGVKKFEAPVRIEVQTKRFRLPIPYRVDDDGRVHLADIGKIGKLTGRLTFSTFVPGTYTWVYDSGLLGWLQLLS